jgi:hypothetical protein
MTHPLWQDAGAGERAARYRHMAEEIRTALDGEGPPSARHALLRMATAYDLLADRVEDMAGKLPG